MSTTQLTLSPPASVWQAESDTAQASRIIVALYEGYGIIVASPTHVQKSTIAHTSNVHVAIMNGRKAFVVKSMPSEGDQPPAKWRSQPEVFNFLHEDGFRSVPKIVLSEARQPFYRQRGIWYMVTVFDDENLPLGNYNDVDKIDVGRIFSPALTVGDMSLRLASFKPSPACVFAHQSPLLEIKNARTKFEELLDQMWEKSTCINGRTLLTQDVYNRIVEFLKDAINSVKESGLDKEPEQVGHFDLHGGNLGAGITSTMVYDFDWLRLAHWLFDLASLLIMCCLNYGGEHDGTPKHQVFQLALQNFLHGRKSMEILKSKPEHLVAALKVYAAIQLLWTTRTYIDDPNVSNLADLRHFISIAICNDFKEVVAAMS